MLAASTKVAMRPARIKKGYGEIEFLLYDLAPLLGRDARKVLTSHVTERTAVFPAGHADHQRQADRAAAHKAWMTYRREEANPPDPAHPPQPPLADEPDDIESFFVAIRLRFINDVSEAFNRLHNFQADLEESVHMIFTKIDEDED